METTTTNKNTGILSQERIDEIFAEHEEKNKNKKYKSALFPTWMKTTFYSLILIGSVYLFNILDYWAPLMFIPALLSFQAIMTVEKENFFEGFWSSLMVLSIFWILLTVYFPMAIFLIGFIVRIISAIEDDTTETTTSNSDDAFWDGYMMSSHE